MPKKKPTSKRAKSANMKAIPVNPTTDRQWKVEGAARTLREAEKLRTDRNLLKEAKQYLRVEAKLNQRAAKG